MKRFFSILIMIGLVLIISSVVSLYPKLSNMSSEYETADAIRDIEKYLLENEGEWPFSPEELGDRYPLNGEVVIDYAITSRELLADPEKLRDAIRPRSGMFYTYPHYDAQLDGLLSVLREMAVPHEIAPQVDEVHLIGE